MDGAPGVRPGPPASRSGTGRRTVRAHGSRVLDHGVLLRSSRLVADRALTHHGAAQRRVTDHEPRVDGDATLEPIEVLADPAGIAPGEYLTLEDLSKAVRAAGPAAAGSADPTDGGGT